MLTFLKYARFEGDYQYAREKRLDRVHQTVQYVSQKLNSDPKV